MGTNLVDDASMEFFGFFHFWMYGWFVFFYFLLWEFFLGWRWLDEREHT